MLPATLRKVRVVVLSSIAGVLFSACSDKASLPSDTENQRIYSCDDIPPPPVRLGGDTFAELYRDVFSIGGVAGCQNTSCHGNSTGPDGNGMAMYASKAVAGGPDTPPGATAGLPDDRGLYCGLTTHLVSVGGSTKKSKTCRGDDCSCRIGDRDCFCSAGPNKGADCCNPATDTDTSCRGVANECDHFCRRLALLPHPDGSDARADSALSIVLFPDKDGNPAFMPNPRPCHTNRKLLPEELARLTSWMKRGAPYDGTTAQPLHQPAYDCPPPVKPTSE
jgi:hypothetical protein